MRRAGRRAGNAALAGCIATCVWLGLASAQTPDTGVEVFDWRLGGSAEVGGMFTRGEHSSSRFNQYRDMSDGFLGEFVLQGEKKDSPYFFELGAKNPGRDDQAYEGSLGMLGMFQLDLSWDRTPHVISNTGRTIYTQIGDRFFLPPSRTTLQNTFTTAPTSAAGRAAIQNAINGLLVPVDLRFSTDVGEASAKFTPTEFLRFDFGYTNIRRQGNRPASVQLAGSTSGPVFELAIPIDNTTHEIKFGAEYARPTWGVQFKYTGSFFENEFKGYTLDNPLVAPTAANAGLDRFSSAPNNMAHAFTLTGTVALPLRTRVNGTFSYTMLRQDDTFDFNIGNTGTNFAGVRRNTDDQGRDSADAKSNIVLGNIVATSRPIDSVTLTARARYFEYENDMPQHTFSNAFVSGGTTPVSAETKNERYRKVNMGFDAGWRPIRNLSLKAGFEWEQWHRADYSDLGDTGLTHPSFANNEYIGKVSADWTPVDWFLGRVTYSLGDRSIQGYTPVPTTELPQSIKYNYSPRIRNKLDTLFQFMPWETVTSSLTFAYAFDDYHKNQFGLTKDDYLAAGIDFNWSPFPWLTISTDYTYEQYNYSMTNRYLVGGTFPGIPANTWQSRSTDQFHNVGLNATVNVIPKKFDITLGYDINFGYTTFQNTNPTPNVGGATASPQATAFGWDKVFNVLQTARVVARYRITDHWSLRGGFAYERANERDWAHDPMAPFMGNYDGDRPGVAGNVAQGVQSVWLGATTPNYEAYIFSGFIRYEF